MGLRGENPFKIRAFDKAASLLGALPPDEDLMARAQAGTLTELNGIGKGIAEVLSEYLLKGTSTYKDELAAALPPGLLELTQIPGLGPKKALQLIEDLDIHSLGELEYACKENRLLNIKGFGVKVQAKIYEGIQFLNATRGQQRISDAFPLAEKAFHDISRAANSGRHPAAFSLRVAETGALRRRLEVLSELEFLVELPPGEKAPAEVQVKVAEAVAQLQKNHPGSLPVRVNYSPSQSYGYEWAHTTATAEHWQALGMPKPAVGLPEGEPDEEAFYRRLDLPWLPAEVRETGEEVSLARAGKWPELLPWDGVTGVFHNHTLRSDGTASLEEMVLAAKALGFQYIGISDHSQTAFYAQGLKVPTLLEQEREVREVQAKHPEIRIFWGIESDILADGSLDYDDSILKKFDFVVASVHSRFQMDEETMTQRILEAIRNPYTRFLGHATGRLLLGRKGYAVDMERIIAEAAKRDVAIEINANPARLDIDWRWGPQLRKNGTLVSVNPDAHDTEGLTDTRYGVAVARKALLPRGQVVNSRSVAEVEKWLRRG